MALIALRRFLDRVQIGTQFVTRDLWLSVQSGCTFNRKHRFRRNLLVPVQPIPDVLLLDYAVIGGNRLGEFSLSAQQIDRTLESFEFGCVHGHEQYNCCVPCVNCCC